jgi:hypothetical protein
MRALIFIASSLLLVATSARADEGTCFDAAVEGQKARKAGHLGEARAAFTRCAEAACPAEVTDRCTRWIAEVDDAMPSIIVDARDAKGRDLARGTVRIDARDQSVLSGKPVSLEPGQHTVILDVPGEKRIEEIVVLHEHEKNRTVVLQLAPPPEPPRKLSAAPFVFGGIGVAFGLGFGALATVGFLDRQRSHCDTICGSADFSRVQTELILADVALGATVVFLGIAIVDFIVTRSAPRRPAAALLTF